MLDTIKAGGREIAIRGLTRKEVKTLRKDHDIDLQALTLLKAEEAQDAVLFLVVSDEDLAFLDDQCNAESLAVFKAILAKTFGREVEEKN